MQKTMNDGWSFALKSENGNDRTFAPVEVPHDWLIYDTNNLYKSGIGVYKRTLDVSFVTESQKVLINFDGVYMDSSLFVNDKLVGEWKHGYTAFIFDITEFIDKSKDNEVRLEVNFKSPNSRWYSGAGIYRDVSLIVKNENYIEPDGVYISTSKKNGQWTFEVSTQVTSKRSDYIVRHELLCDKGRSVDFSVASEEKKALTDEPISYEVCGEVAVWDIESPSLYTLKTQLIVDGVVQDEVFTRFGFREIKFTENDGFFLGGRHLKLNGVCLHHDLGALGAATHRDAIVRQFTLLRDMGVNALRTAHNPPSKIFMELADEMGFLVMSEITDIWEQSKTEYDYARFFDEWIERDIAAWVRRDRNSPSVIMWSIGNEIYDTHADADRGAEITKRLIGYVEQNDPRKNAVVTFSSNYLNWENTQKSANILGLVGYNYAEFLYEKHHEQYPDRIIYGGETASTLQSRNIYRFPLSQSLLADDDLQCSSLGNCTTSWGSESAEICALADKKAPFSLGQFIWTGQDYIGEPTPYQTKNSYFGQIDTAGFYKDSFYIFKAAWSSEPVVHIFPYWDHSPGQMIDVRVATNAHSVELYLNEKSLGKVMLYGRLIADYRLPYETGTLLAIGYDKDGQVCAETKKTSFTDALRVGLKTDVFGELRFVSITAYDKDGKIVENANNRIFVNVKDGELLGLDNGDSSDFEQYKTDNRRLFGGRLLAIVRKTGDKEPVVTAQISSDEIPIRKIEIERDEFVFRAKIYPEDATFDDISWRVTNAKGADSPLATFEMSEDKREIKLKARGDGEVWVRCMAKNGREHVSLISQMSFDITGIGTKYASPYTFIAGALSDLSNVSLSNGNERGIATLRDGESHVGFSELDFGSFGSDELNIPLFPLIHDPLDFEVWEGMPDSGGEFIAKFTYDKGMIWNTYQDVHIKLPRKIKGITTICFVFRTKVHIKGFAFTSQSKAFSRLFAATDNSGIYGDSFTLTQGAVEKIGNNVAIEFSEMDFGDTYAENIKVCWRSSREKNSMQIRFSSGSKEIISMIDIPASKDYSDEIFSLGEKISGNQKVQLIFLPGCEIDLKWIEFC